MEAIYFFSILWALVSALLGAMIYYQIKDGYSPKNLPYQKAVYAAYVVAYGMVSFMLGFIPHGFILALIWIALAAVQYGCSYLVFNKTNWSMVKTFWATTVFHGVQFVALITYLVLQ